MLIWTKTMQLTVELYY